MISKQRALFYFVGDQAFKSLEDAQKCDLKALIGSDIRNLWKASSATDNCDDLIAQWIMKNKDAIVDTLTTTPTSRLKARKLHGGKRKPKSATVPTAS